MANFAAFQTMVIFAIFAAFSSRFLYRTNVMRGSSVVSHMFLMILMLAFDHVWKSIAFAKGPVLPLSKILQFFEH